MLQCFATENKIKVGMATNGGNGIVYTDNSEQRRWMKMENPFSLKVGQVFTGFGIGCGIGIGVGRPLNLGAIPVLNQVMMAARGASDAFAGVQRHVNSSLRKVGAKNVEAGIGCGVGFGHGFGVGLAIKPSVLHQIQSQLLKLATNVVKRLGLDSSSTLSVSQGILPASLQTGKTTVNESLPENARVISQLVKSGSNSTHDSKISDRTNISSSEGTLAPKGAVVNTEYSSRTEKVLDNFLNSPLFKEEGSSGHEQAGAMHLESNMLQMVLKHQVLIEELIKENDKLRQILVEELKLQPGKLHSISTFTSRSNSSCTECFECRRKQRRR